MLKENERILAKLEALTEASIRVEERQKFAADELSELKGDFKVLKTQQGKISEKHLEILTTTGKLHGAVELLKKTPRNKWETKQILAAITAIIAALSVVVSYMG